MRIILWKRSRRPDVLTPIPNTITPISGGSHRNWLPIGINDRMRCAINDHMPYAVLVRAGDLIEAQQKRVSVAAASEFRPSVNRLPFAVEIMRQRLSDSCPE